MDLLEDNLQIIGIAMCVLALVPLAFWSIQSWSTFRHNQSQFRDSQELMRQQILEVINRQAGSQVDQNIGVSQQSMPHAQDQDVASQTMSAPAESSVGLEVSGKPEILANGTWKGFRQFRVQNLVKETETCTSVYLTPVDGEAIADFQAGQHLPLRFEIPGQPKPVIRCYSLSAGPGKPHYRISVKAMPAGNADQPAGLVSNYINLQLKVGDVIESRAPSGSFSIDLTDSRPVVMLAGGIGITPMISMIESLVAHSPNRLVLLLYGVRNKADQAFREFLVRAETEHERFCVVHHYSDPQPGDVEGVAHHVKGYVSIDLLKKLMPNPDCQFYLCGSPPFMNSLNGGLEAWGVSKDQIFSEAFGPASIKKTKAPASVQEVAGAIEVVFEQSGKTATWSPENESLLDLAEANGVEIDFGCRAGSCGTCAKDLLTGKVEYPEGQQVDCEPGQCLTCIARPTGSTKLGA